MAKAFLNPPNETKSKKNPILKYESPEWLTAASHLPQQILTVL